MDVSALDTVSTGTETKAESGGPSLALGWILLLALVNGLLWMALVPPWQTPDEPKHFEYLRLLSEGERLIAFETEEEAGDPELQAWIVDSMDAQRFWWYGHAPGYDPDVQGQTFADLWLFGSHTAFYRSSPAYYALLAPFQPDNRMLGLYMARFLSMLMVVLTVLLAGLAARELFPEAPFVRYGAPLFLALHPMQAFLQAGVNNDGLVVLLSAFAFLLMARLLVRGFHPARLILLGLVIVLAILSKRTAFFLAPAALLTLLSAMAARSRRPALALGGGLGMLSFLFLGLRSWGPQALAALPEAWRFTISRYLLNEPDQIDRLMVHLRAPEIGGVMLEYLWRMHEGFWGSFGWQVVGFPAPVYLVFGLLVVVAGVGVLKRLLALAEFETDVERKHLVQAAALTSYAAAVALAAGGALFFFASYLHLPYPPPPQGRYLFVASLPIALLMTAGISAFLPRGRDGVALQAWMAILLIYDMTALLGIVLPYFYR